jgi:hypothetical protein
LRVRNSKKRKKKFKAKMKSEEEEKVWGRRNIIEKMKEERRKIM